MKLIVISSPIAVPNEHEIINSLKFHYGTSKLEVTNCDLKIKTSDYF